MRPRRARVIVVRHNPETLATARATLGTSPVVLSSDSASLPEAQGLRAVVQKHATRLDPSYIIGDEILIDGGLRLT